MKEQLDFQASEVGINDLKLKGFKAYRIETSVHPIPNNSRPDFYKVCLVTGNSHIQYADKEIIVDGPYLFFGNPHIPYSSEVISGKLPGYACLIT